jgi:molecular chaperone Hsp33
MTDSADFALPFRIEGQNVNGRIVKLNQLASDVLSRHNYPEEVGRLLGEALVLAAMLGTVLKFDGRFILQLQGKGPISMLMGDYAQGGALRGFAQFDQEKLDAALANGDSGLALLGANGHMAFTVDQGADMERYQGIVPLEGENLAQAALEYFHRSEQIATSLRLAAAPMILPGGKTEWRAGGILLQQAAKDGGTDSPPDRELRVESDDWQRLTILLQTTEDSELLDAELEAETLAYRLFNEDGVRVFDARPLHFDCPCSRDRVKNMLSGLSETDQDEMQEQETIEVRCEFCNELYLFSPTEAFSASGA